MYHDLMRLLAQRFMNGATKEMAEDWNALACLFEAGQSGNEDVELSLAPGTNLSINPWSLGCAIGYMSPFVTSVLVKDPQVKHNAHIPYYNKRSYVEAAIAGANSAVSSQKTRNGLDCLKLLHNAEVDLSRNVLLTAPLEELSVELVQWVCENFNAISMIDKYQLDAKSSLKAQAVFDVMRSHREHHILTTLISEESQAAPLARTCKI